MLTYILIILGFIFLIKGADYLIDGASAIAKRLRVSDLVIGLTIVAFGTSAPELIVNVFASFQGNAEIAIGNILGSNTANIFLILGVASIIYSLRVTKNTVWKEIPLSFLAAVILGIMANDRLIDRSNFSMLTRIDGLVFLTFFLIFMYYTYGIAKTSQNSNKSSGAPQFGFLKAILYILGGLCALFIGGKLVVDAAIKIALALGVSELLIGLTIVAVGTSLPELFTSAIAALKKNSDLAIGTVVGSNIFNIFFILGISALINPLPFQEKSNVDIFVTILASFLLFVAMFVGKKRLLERWQGIAFIVLYIIYLGFLIMRG